MQTSVECKCTFTCLRYCTDVSSEDLCSGGLPSLPTSRPGGAAAGGARPPGHLQEDTPGVPGGLAGEGDPRLADFNLPKLVSGTVSSVAIKTGTRANAETAAKSKVKFCDKSNICCETNAVTLGPTKGEIALVPSGSFGSCDKVRSKKGLPVLSGQS